MKRLNFASYVKNLQTGLQAPNGNKDVVELLLLPITSKETVRNQNGGPIDINDTFVSNLLKQKKPVPDEIKSASADPKVITETHSYFNSDIMPYLNPHTKEDMLENLTRIIKNSDISVKKQAELLSKYTSGDVAKFLSNSFLYALNSPNTVIDVPVDENDFYLLSEAHHTCPQCGNQLVKTKNDISLKEYEIVNIYPTNLTKKEAASFGNVRKLSSNLKSNANRLPLCLTCANEYTAHRTPEACQNLIHKKNSLVRNYKAMEITESIFLEEQIEKVLRQISSADISSAFEQLSYNALKVRSKISTDNVPLILKTEAYVLGYHNFIKTTFAELQREGILDFEEIAMTVKLCYKKLAKQGLSQEEVWEHLTDWFKQNANTTFSSACEVIVAFFIQNCEVFDEVTQ